jgi:hypothetical protein
MQEGMGLFPAFGVLMFLAALFLAPLLIILTFAVFGIKRKIDLLISQVKELNTSLNENVTKI